MALTVSRRAVAGTALAVALAAPPAGAGLRDTYGEALAAMEAEQWREAERLFREAAELHAAEARRLPLKRILKPYLPHYYLGAVLARQGDCRGALASWQLSSDQGVVDKLGLGGDLGARRSSCEQRLGRLAGLTEQTESALAAAERTAERLSEPSRAPLLSLGFEGGLGTLGQRLEGSRERAAEARARLERAAANQDPELAEQARELALEIAIELDEAVEELEQIAGRVAAARASKRRRIEEVDELARRVEERLRARASLPPELHSRRQELESLLSSAFALRESATMDQIERLELRLASFSELLERSEEGPPGTLRSGAIAFLRADYQAVLERLAEIPDRDPKSRAHGLLLRSAAAYALYAAGGELDAELLERARRDVLAARRSAPGLAPAPRAFSPRFVRFFDSVVQPPPGG